ncbi:MAG: c-type cytochrome, partial [Deinococcus sp.]
MRWVLPVALLGTGLAVAGTIYALRPGEKPEMPMPQGSVMAGSALVDQNYCAFCHGGKGQPTNAAIPNLGGQQVGFLYKNMLRFHHDLGNIPNVRVTSMVKVFPLLNTQQIADIATFYAAQKPVDAWPSLAGADPLSARKLYMNGDSALQVVACQVCHTATGQGDPARGTPSLLHQSPGDTLLYLQA